MVAAGAVVLMISLQSNLLRAVAENTTHVIGMMEFGAVRADTPILVLPFRYSLAHGAAA